MDTRTLGIFFHVWVVIAVSIGILLIVVSSSNAVATVGAVLIMIGLASLMPAFRFYWWESQETETGPEPE